MANYLTAWRAAPQILCPTIPWFSVDCYVQHRFSVDISLFAPLPPIKKIIFLPLLLPPPPANPRFYRLFCSHPTEIQGLSEAGGAVYNENGNWVDAHSLCLLLINFGPFSTPPTESLWGKQASACGKLKFLHICIISRCPQLLTFPHISNVIFLHSPYLRIFSFRLWEVVFLPAGGSQTSNFKFSFRLWEVVFLSAGGSQTLNFKL